MISAFVREGSTYYATIQDKVSKLRMLTYAEACLLADASISYADASVSYADSSVSTYAKGEQAANACRGLQGGAGLPEGGASRCGVF